MTEKIKTDSLQDFLERMAFQKIKKMLQENAGVNCSGYRDEYLKRRFDIRLRATGSETYGGYILYLKNNSEEFKNLLNDLTVNYTMFFRDQDVYMYLEKVLLPKIFSAPRPIKIWSAGCATGEEPYSLAILAHKVLGRRIAAHPVTIFATDIDKDALATAKRGQYNLKQLGNLEPSLIDQFFQKEGEIYQINESLRQIINFHEFDLMASPPRQNIDLVLCRNVMIYFSKQGQQQIHMSFFGALREGGYLVTGKSEILSGEPAVKFLPVDIQVRVYQKPQKTNDPVQFGTLNFCSKSLSV